MAEVKVLMHIGRAIVSVLVLAVLGACSTGSERSTAIRHPGGGADGVWTLSQPFSKWVDLDFPAKTRSLYRPYTEQGQEYLHAQSDGTASMYRWQMAPPMLGVGRVKFSWRVPKGIAQANIADRYADDAPARLVLAFEGDRRRFSAMDAVLAELTLALTGEPMPYATLMYVWCETCAVDRVVPHGRTERIRYIELAAPKGQRYDWQHFERNVGQDFALAFGESMGPLESVGIMTDSDNTKSQVFADFGPVTLLGNK